MAFTSSRVTRRWMPPWVPNVMKQLVREYNEAFGEGGRKWLKVVPGKISDCGIDSDGCF